MAESPVSAYSCQNFHSTPSIPTTADSCTRTTRRFGSLHGISVRQGISSLSDIGFGTQSSRPTPGIPFSFSPPPSADSNVLHSIVTSHICVP